MISCLIIDSKPFPPGVKVHLSGDDYLCENCVQPLSNENSNNNVEGCKLISCKYLC